MPIVITRYCMHCILLRLPLSCVKFHTRSQQRANAFFHLHSIYTVNSIYTLSTQYLYLLTSWPASSWWLTDPGAEIRRRIVRIVKTPVKASHPPIKKMFMGHKHCFLNNTKACRLLRPPDCRPGCRTGDGECRCMNMRLSHNEQQQRKQEYLSRQKTKHNNICCHNYLGLLFSDFLY